MSILEKIVVRSVEEQRWIDRIAGPLQRPVHELLEHTSWLRTVLHGTWLRHPLHVALTDVPVGAWTVGLVLDLMDLFGINRHLRRGADASQAIGLVGAMGAAIAGVADWSFTEDRPRRVGFIHGIANVLIAALCGGSLLARSRGNRTTGIALSGLGYGLLMFSTWLGGELVYRFGIGVSHGAFRPEIPEQWESVLSDRDLREGELHRVEVAGTPILLARYQGQIHAIGDTCTHMGCSLSEGNLERDQVECRCHGSHFRIDDGQVMVGPATVSEPYYETRVRNGRIEIRRPEIRFPVEREVFPTPPTVEPPDYRYGQGI